jgi:hypothetical protein
MTGPSDTWPHYHSGPSKHVHALGVLSLEFNSFEASFFALFSHHLQTRGIPPDTLWVMFSQLHESKYESVIRGLFEQYESDKAVLDHIDHVFKHFHKCNDSRNTLLHSVHHAIAHDALHMQKSIRGKFEPVQVLILPLDRLRRIADAMHDGSLYLGRLVVYLARRDGILPDAEILNGVLGPPTLPEKPALPDTLEPAHTPRHLVDTWFPPPPSEA